MFSDRNLSEYRNKYQGESVIVCGLGSSLLANLDQISKYNTIGVNDVGELFTPTFHVVAERMHIPDTKVKPVWESKWACILQSRSEHIFSVIDLPFAHTKPVQIETENLYENDIDEMFSRNMLWKWNKSTMVALSLACYMGFAWIGVVGFDLHGDRACCNQTNVLRMNSDKVKIINDGCTHVDKWARTNGVRILNCSPDSLVTAFDYGRLE